MILKNEDLRWRLQGIASFKSLWEDIRAIPRIRILSEVLDGNCEVYVFQTVNDEEWFREILEQSERWPPVGLRESLIFKLRTEPVRFLQERGYRVVESPGDEDLVLYKRSGRGDALHWGIWERGKVRSKWADWYVFEHEVDAVPICYGDEVVFLRRTD